MSNKHKFPKLLTVILVALAFCLMAFSGCAGKSAYELAVENGYTGSVTEWLSAQKGKSAYELAILNGFVGSETEWIASLKVGDVALEDLYEFYKMENPLVTLDEFVTIFFASSHDPVQDAIQKTLRSAVSIRAQFGGLISGNVSAGSGIIFKLDRETGVAYIITNYHVIYDTSVSTSIRLCPFGKEYFGDGGELNLSIRADFIGGSITKDIAVLKTRENEILKGSEYRVADLADSNKLTIGETVIAVGNPEGMGISATKGILNVESEYIYVEKIDASSGDLSHRVLRIDAAINGGNSGGGLYNKYGDLIGIVNAKAVDEEIDNIGYAIPSNVALGIAKIVLEEVKQGGKFVKYQIGITTAVTGSRAVLEEGIMRIKEELTVTLVESGKPSSGKLRLGDILLSAKINDLEEVELARNYTLSDYLYNARPGDKLVVKVLRNNEEVTVEPIIIDARFFVEV